MHLHSSSVSPPRFVVDASSESRHAVVLVTGATGLLGRAVLSRMLRDDSSLRAFVLVRDSVRWAEHAVNFGRSVSRITPIVGDITRPGLALDAASRSALSASATAVVHLAADTSFSRPLEESRRVNTAGTHHLLEISELWPHMKRFAYVSTAFVAGCRTGDVLEEDSAAPDAWVNAYEQSKWEAEQLVRSSSGSWVIFRPSTIVCDSSSGEVTQVNAVHRALRVYNNGLAAMMPGSDDSLLDVVPLDYVADAVATLALQETVEHSTLHLCAGSGAMPLAELLDTTYEIWAGSGAWRRRGVMRPPMAALDTYRLFERSVKETGSARLGQIIDSLSHFVPQLALPKRFDTRAADRALGMTPPVVRDFWPNMIQYLLETTWGTRREAAA